METVLGFGLWVLVSLAWWAVQLGLCFVLVVCFGWLKEKAGGG